jgi:hypothetical protein
MADSNNHRVGDMPTEPHPLLRTLEPLIGEWQNGGGLAGRVRFEWMDGGFYCVQHFHFVHDGREIRGVESSPVSRRVRR